MSMLQKIGYPAPDADGTLRIKCVEERGEIRLVCNGEAFVVCKMLDGKAVVQVVDADTGVKYQGDIGMLCWAR